MKLPKIELKNVIIEKIYPIKEGNIKTREIAFSWVEEDKTKYIKAQCKNEKCSVLNKFSEGDTVDITLVISCLKKFGQDDQAYYYQNINLNYIKNVE